MRSLLCLAALLAAALARHHHHHKAADDETTVPKEQRSVSAAELIQQGKEGEKDDAKVANDWDKQPDQWGGSGSSSHPGWGNSGSGSSSHHGSGSHGSYPSYYYGGHGSGRSRHHGRRGRHHGGYYPPGYYYGGRGHHGRRGGHHDPYYYPGYYGGHFDPVHRGRGSKHRQCGPGYYWDEKAWGCADLDECDHQQQSLCPYGRTCVNVPGSYRCVKRHHGSYGPPPKDDDDCAKPTCESIGMKTEENCEVYADGDPSWSITMSEKTKLSEDDCCLLCKQQHGCIYAEYQEATKHHEGYCQMYKSSDSPYSKPGDYTCMYFD